MSTQTLKKEKVLDYEYESEILDDIAEFEDILAHPENHKGYRTAREMLHDMGLI